MCVCACVCGLRACVVVHPMLIPYTHTSMAAYLMNCLADCLQMAGTVITHCTSAGVTGSSDMAISLSSLRQVSRKNLRAWENTTEASTRRPLDASSSMFRCKS